MSQYLNIPVLTKDILDRYAGGARGALTGHTRPLVENQFVDAVLRADGATLAALREIAEYIENELPSDCWGSPEAVRSWTWRDAVAKHPEAKRVARIERDERRRLGPDSHAINRYALTYEVEDGKEYEVPLFIECLGLFPTEAAAVAYFQTMHHEPAAGR